MCNNKLLYSCVLLNEPFLSAHTYTFPASAKHIAPPECTFIDEGTSVYSNNYNVVNNSSSAQREGKNSAACVGLKLHVCRAMEIRKITVFPSCIYITLPNYVQLLLLQFLLF